MKGKLQFFLNNLNGITFHDWFYGSDLMEKLRKAIQNNLGIPIFLLSLVFEGKLMQEVFQVKYYGIERNLTIILNLRLQEGDLGHKSPKGPNSFKVVVEGRIFTPTNQIQNM